jgi:predicted DNA-binding transcriptional regulator YafY
VALRPAAREPVNGKNLALARLRQNLSQLPCKVLRRAKIRAERGAPMTGMAENFLRYLMVLREIPRAPRRIDTETLAVRLESHGLRVSRRTLQRDLERLSGTFPLVCADQSKPYGWSWVDEPSRDRPGPSTQRLRALGQIARDRLLQKVAPTRKMRVVLRFYDRAAVAMAREICNDASTRRERGCVRVEAVLRDTPELRTWLKSLGTDVEILKPRQLRAEFRAMAGKLAGLYDSD